MGAAKTACLPCRKVKVAQMLSPRPGSELYPVYGQRSGVWDASRDPKSSDTTDPVEGGGDGPGTSFGLLNVLASVANDQSKTATMPTPPGPTSQPFDRASFLAEFRTAANSLDPDPYGGVAVLEEGLGELYKCEPFDCSGGDVVNARIDQPRLDVGEGYDVVSSGIVTEDEVQSLMAIYWDRIEPVGRVLDPTIHTIEFITAKSATLMSVVLMITAQSLPVSEHANSLVSRLDAHVEHLLAQTDRHGFQSIEICQALTLLCLFIGGHQLNRTWGLTAKSIAMAIELRLDASPPPVWALASSPHHQATPAALQRNVERLWILLVDWDRATALNILTRAMPIFAGSDPVLKVTSLYTYRYYRIAYAGFRTMRLICTAPGDRNKDIYLLSIIAALARRLVDLRLHANFASITVVLGRGLLHDARVAAQSRLAPADTGISSDSILEFVVDGAGPLDPANGSGILADYSGWSMAALPMFPGLSEGIFGMWDPEADNWDRVGTAGCISTCSAMADTLADDLTVPGTVVILDQVAGDDLPSKNFTLVPTPSADPNDPLNWSKGRKWLSLLCLNLWILAVFTVVGCLYPIYGPLSDTTGLSLDNINAGVGYLYFAAAVFALFTLPLQIAIGYRPVFIATCLGVCIFPFALSQVKNNGQYIGLCVLNALFVSPVFVSPETVLCNVFGMNGPTYFAGGFAVLVAIFLFFFMEETKFHRPVPSSGPVEVLTSDNKALSASPYAPDTKDAALTEVKPADTKEVPPATTAATHSDDRYSIPWPGIRPFQRFAVSPHAVGILWRGAAQSVALLRLPIVLWCGLVMGTQQIFYNTMAALSSGVLSAEPYNMQPNAVGLTFISPLLAIVPGAVLGGWLSDRLTVIMARRNGGVSEAEHKLWLFIVPTIVCPIGILMMGLGPYYGAHWMVFVIGEFFLTVAGPLATLNGMTYAFDCFHPIHPKAKEGPTAEVQAAAPYILAAMLLGMAMTFSFNYSITAWAFNWGLRNWAISAALIGTVANSTAFVMIRYGKKLRKGGAGYYEKVVNI
ncbi:putative MFS-type transporterc [Vanrija pseudolonga]|uniref:Purtative MFS-type transporterc n=1 Tax=Vanrija pseudolonga TaxID=143232 RepID=A0AAF0Y8S5_9TREE|nr:purtative MFS-type transporterc [Vanrija pseudolonga]